MDRASELYRPRRCLSTPQISSVQVLSTEDNIHGDENCRAVDTEAVVSRESESLKRRTMDRKKESDEQGDKGRRRCVRKSHCIKFKGRK